MIKRERLYLETKIPKIREEKQVVYIYIFFLFFNLIFNSVEKNYRKYLISFSFQKLKIPWSAILTSGPVWAIFIAQCVSHFIFILMQSYTPTYFKEVLRMKLTDVSSLARLVFANSLHHFYTTRTFQNIPNTYVLQEKMCLIRLSYK